MMLRYSHPIYTFCWNPIGFCFKTVFLTTIPALPYFWPKWAEHDVTLTSFTASLPEARKESFGQNMQHWPRKGHAKFSGDISFRYYPPARSPTSYPSTTRCLAVCGGHLNVLDYGEASPAHIAFDAHACKAACPQGHLNLDLWDSEKSGTLSRAHCVRSSPPVTGQCSAPVIPG